MLTSTVLGRESIGERDNSLNELAGGRVDDMSKYHSLGLYTCQRTPSVHRHSSPSPLIFMLAEARGYIPLSDCH